MEALVFDLLITAVGYLIVPLIVIITGKKYSEFKLKKIAIINGAVAWLIFSIISINAGGEASKGAATILWAFLGYFLMKKYCLAAQQDPTTINETEQETKQISVNEVRCPECGEINQEGSTTCVKCGHPLAIKKSNAKNMKPVFIVVAVVVLLALGALGISQLVREQDTKNNLSQEDNENYDDSNIKEIASILKKYNKEFSATDYDSVKALLDERGDFGDLEDLESRIEFVKFFDYGYDYDYDNDLILEPTIMKCLIIKATEENQDFSDFMQEYKTDHYMQDSHVGGIGILTKSGETRDLIYTNEYVEAVNNARVGNIGNYYYYIASKNEAAIDDIINAFK